MIPQIKLIKNIDSKKDIVLLCNSIQNIQSELLTADELTYLKGLKEAKDQTRFFVLDRLGVRVFVVEMTKTNKCSIYLHEYFRIAGNDFLKYTSLYELDSVQVVNLSSDEKASLMFAEGMALGSYTYTIKKKKEEETKKIEFATIELLSDQLTEVDVEQMNIVVEATCKNRDLANEPQQSLDSVEIAKRFESMGKEAGFKVEVLHKKQIESLKMGGLLGVNRGSITPPTFSIMTYKPENAINKKPYVLVGKGVVFDTGGVNIKPGDYMTNMHMDMAGSSMMASAIYSVAKAKLPLYVICLVAATDNRPSNNAYTPNDVLTMYDGTTVEVLNTDAEGRLTLGDALAYAKQYDPELVIDSATLTGAAHRAVGSVATCAMHKDASEAMEELKKSGFRTYERLVEFPMWEDYGEMIKSQVADIKNLGGAEAGMITAGKFLEHFVDYPWVHLDIAGPSILDKREGYRTFGGSGVGTRMLFDFFQNKVK